MPACCKSLHTRGADKAFFPKIFYMNFSIIKEWYKHDRNSARGSITRNGNLKLIRAPANETSNHDLKGVKLVTTSRLGLSNLFERKFKHVSKMP